jgi:hypothetical protein
MGRVLSKFLSALLQNRSHPSESETRKSGGFFLTPCNQGDKLNEPIGETTTLPAKPGSFTENRCFPSLIYKAQVAWEYGLAFVFIGS